MNFEWNFVYREWGTMETKGTNMWNLRHRNQGQFKQELFRHGWTSGYTLVVESEGGWITQTLVTHCSIWTWAGTISVLQTCVAYGCLLKGALMTLSVYFDYFYHTHTYVHIQSQAHAPYIERALT